MFELPGDQGGHRRRHLQEFFDDLIENTFIHVIERFSGPLNTNMKLKETSKPRGGYGGRRRCHFQKFFVDLLRNLFWMLSTLIRR